MTEHAKSNVYISAFITAYSRLKLYELLEQLNEKVLYFDTDSIVYVSPTGEHLVTPDTTGDLGEWTSELPPDDYFVEFVSAGPKTYAMKSFSGERDVSKSKGFSLHYADQQVYNFETLKDQILSKAINDNKEKLVLHTNETIMQRRLFDIEVRNNNGKMLNMTYDKRAILPTSATTKDEIKMIDTLPFGHVDLCMLELDY